MTTLDVFQPGTSSRSSRAPGCRYDQARLESLTVLIAELGSDEAVSREGFSEAFGRAQKVLELDDNEVAKTFQISRPTVGRWVRGESAPHAVGRRPILDAFRRVAERKHRQLNNG